MTLAGRNYATWAVPTYSVNIGEVGVNCYGRAVDFSTGASGTWPTADLAISQPVRIKTRVVVTKLYAGVSISSGNVDIGLYDAGGTLLVSKGTAAATTSYSADITDTTVGPGLFYIALVADNTTLQCVFDNDVAPMYATAGVMTQQLGAGAALPSSATWTVPQTLAYVPEVAVFLGTIA